MSRMYVFNQAGGPEHEELVDRPVPEPGAGEVLVEVRAAGVNPADWKMREGHFGRGAAPPVPMGREVAGVVTALGAGVSDLLGRAVLGPVAAGTGSFGDHALLNAADVLEKPEDISFAEAATSPVAGTTTRWS